MLQGCQFDGLLDGAGVAQQGKVVEVGRPLRSPRPKVRHRQQAADIPRGLGSMVVGFAGVLD